MTSKVRGPFSRALDAYETFLGYTLIPSVFVLMGVVFAEAIGVWTAPQVVFYGLMVHYLGGVLYSMADQSRRYRDA